MFTKALHQERLDAPKTAATHSHPTKIQSGIEQRAQVDVYQFSTVGVQYLRPALSLANSSIALASCVSYARQISAVGLPMHVAR